jgi:hypothetical protein
VSGMHLDLFPMSLRKDEQPVDPRKRFARSVALSLAATTAVVAGRRLIARRGRTPA